MKKNIFLGSLAGLFIGLLSMPVAYNLGYSSMPNLLFVALGLFVGSIIASVAGVFLGKWISLLFQITKFGIIGVLNTLVDFGILNLLIVISSVATGLWFTIFKSISFLVAVINSYFWNKYWTFESHKKSDVSEMMSFFAVSIVGFLINVITASIIVNVVPILFGANGNVWANIGALGGTILALAWNFVGYKFFVFKKTPVKKSSV